MNKYTFILRKLGAMQEKSGVTAGKERKWYHLHESGKKQYGKRERRGEKRDQAHVSKLLLSMLGWPSPNHCGLAHLN